MQCGTERSRAATPKLGLLNRQETAEPSLGRAATLRREVEQALMDEVRGCARRPVALSHVETQFDEVGGEAPGVSCGSSGL